MNIGCWFLLYILECLCLRQILEHLFLLQLLELLFSRFLLVFKVFERFLMVSAGFWWFRQVFERFLLVSSSSCRTFIVGFSKFSNVCWWFLQIFERLLFSWCLYLQIFEHWLLVSAANFRTFVSSLSFWIFVVGFFFKFVTNVLPTFVVGCPVFERLLRFFQFFNGCCWFPFLQVFEDSFLGFDSWLCTFIVGFIFLMFLNVSSQFLWVFERWHLNFIALF